MVTKPEPSAPEAPAINVPDWTTAPPVKVELAPLSCRVPVPALINCTTDEPLAIAPERVSGEVPLVVMVTAGPRRRAVGAGKREWARSSPA